MQLTFADAEHNHKKKRTRRDRFLADLNSLVPWALIEAEIEPFYPKTDGKRGRPAIGLSCMLRLYVVQQCFGFSDEGTEDAVYDSQAIRQFLGISLGKNPVPDATTLLRFRRLLETHELTPCIFAAIKQHLADKGLFLKEGTIVDATLISAPPSTKNNEKQRDPEMHQTKKGNQYYFGMKAHIGVDADSGMVHSLVTTAANVHDVTQTHALLHGEEKSIHGDSGYRGAEKREENKAKKLDWYIAMRPGKRRVLTNRLSDQFLEEAEQVKSKIRSKVEHPFQIVKVRFGYRKTRYRGLAKNTAQLFSLFALANLFLMKKHLAG